MNPKFHEEIFFNDKPLRKRMFSFLGGHPKSDNSQMLRKDRLMEVIKGVGDVGEVYLQPVRLGGKLDGEFANRRRLG